MQVTNRIFYCRVCGEGYTNSVEALGCESRVSIDQPFQVGEAIHLFPLYEAGTIDCVKEIASFRHGWLVTVFNSYLMNKDAPEVNMFYFCDEGDVQVCKVKG